MPSEDPGLGRLIQRRELPASTGMDAMEARLVIVQEVPPKAEVRFYAVRGDLYEQLPSDDALSVLRNHVPPKPVTALSEDELLIEITVLRAEIAEIRPIYLAARTWREHRRSWPGDTTADGALVAAVDAATAEKSR